jgi:hypothetical protein
MSSAHIFVDDVFISYRHLDNELLDEQGKGWIDNFHERFEIVLGEALGYEPKIWRDLRLAGNAYFADVLKEQIKKTAVIISILSPGYLQSDWCIGELREFCRLADQTAVYSWATECAPSKLSRLISSASMPRRSYRSNWATSFTK